MNDKLPEKHDASINDIRLIIPIFLLKKLILHPLTKGLYPVSLGSFSQKSHFHVQQNKPKFYGLIYCHTGSGILKCSHKEKKIKQGDLVIIPPNNSYYFSSSELTTNTIYWINFSGDLASNFAERLLMKMDDGVAQVSAVANVLADFDNLLALGRRGYTATNVIHAVHVLQQALSYLALQLRVESFNNSSTFDVEAVETLMKNNLHQELSLDTLAHYAQLSKFHFSKKFKELTDTSPIQHFINMKIQRACYQLDNSDVSIKRIGEELGYSDPYYFSRLFKKMIGMSPKQYRDSRHRQQ